MDDRAFAELYCRFSVTVYRYALKRMRDPRDAEDIVQEVFCQAWQRAADYNPDRGSELAWLLTITRSRCIDRLRARQSRPSAAIDVDRDAEVMPATIDDPERQASAREEASRLWHSVARLPFVQQVLLHLAHSEALSHGEVARRMCQPLGTVKTRLRDAHARLRDQRLAIQSFNALRSAKQ